MRKIKKWFEKQHDIYRGLDFPIDRIIGKSFSTPSLLPHQRLLEQYEAHGRYGFDWKETHYFRRITVNTESPESSFDALPTDLDVSPTWWLMPWAWYPSKTSYHDHEALEKRAFEKISCFFDLYESIKECGYDIRKGGAIRGYILEHPFFGRVFNQIDGHHRMAILDFLSRNYVLNNKFVRVFPIDSICRDEVYDQSSCRKGLRQGVFSEKDVLRLFDHPFQQLGLEKEKKI